MHITHGRNRMIMTLWYMLCAFMQLFYVCITQVLLVMMHDIGCIAQGRPDALRMCKGRCCEGGHSTGRVVLQGGSQGGAVAGIPVVAMCFGYNCTYDYCTVWVRV